MRQTGDETTTEDLGGCPFLPGLGGLLPPSQSSRDRSAEGPHVFTHLLLISSRESGIPQVPGLYSFTHCHGEAGGSANARENRRGHWRQHVSHREEDSQFWDKTPRAEKRAGAPGSMKDPTHSRAS